MGLSQRPPFRQRTSVPQPRANPPAQSPSEAPPQPQAPSLTAQAILSQFATGGLRANGRGVLFLSGFNAPRITAYSQQNRAISLVEALVEADWLHPKSDGGTSPARSATRIGVIGGGLTGVTFAYWAASHGAQVSLYEKAGDVLTVYDDADHRILHPGLFNWPHPGWEQAATGLPCLHWTQNTAQKIGRELRERFWALEEQLGPTRLQVLTGLKELHLQRGQDPDVPLVVGAAGLPDQHDLLVFAVGFGADGPPGPAYWKGDEDRQFMAQALTTGTRRVVVLGNGDGALMDVLRLRTRLKDEAEVLGFLRDWEAEERASYDRVITAIRAAEPLGRQAAPTEAYHRVLDDALRDFKPAWPIKHILDQAPDWSGRWIEVLGRQGALHARQAPLLRTLWYCLLKADEGKTVRHHQVTVNRKTWKLPRPWPEDGDPATINLTSRRAGLLVLNRLGPDRPLQALQALSLKQAKAKPGAQPLLEVADQAELLAPIQEADFYTHHFRFAQEEKAAGGYRRPALGFSQPAPEPAVLSDHLRKVMEQTAAHVAIPVLIRSKGDPVVAPGDPLRLLSVFVGLDVVKHSPPGGAVRGPGKEAGAEPNPPVPFLTALEAPEGKPLRRLLVAEGGRGKTTLLGFLTLALTAGDAVPKGLDREVVSQLKSVRSRWADKQPWLIRLRDLPRLALEAGDRFEWVLWSQLFRQAYPHEARQTSSVERTARLVPEWFRLPLLEALERGKVLLLLDGMDELPDGERNSLAECLGRFVGTGGAGAGVDVLLSARTATVIGPTDNRWVGNLALAGNEPWPVLEIQRLSDARPSGQPSQQERFASRYFSLLGVGTSNPASELLRAAKERDLTEMTAEPLLLAGLVRLYHHKQHELPQTRVGVLDGVIRLMLTEWDVHRKVPSQVPNRVEQLDPRVNSELCLDALKQVAIKSLEAVVGKSAIRYRDLRDQLEDRLNACDVRDADREAIALAKTLIERVGLLRQTGESKASEIDFPVAIYRNYLAGIGLLADPAGPESPVKEWVRWLRTSSGNSEHWGQALALGVAAWEQGLVEVTGDAPSEGSGGLTERKPSGRTWRLLGALLDEAEAAKDPAVTGHLLAAAGEVARETRIHRHFPAWANDSAPPELKALRERALTAFQGPREGLKALALRAGWLGWLGDPRPGVGRSGTKGDHLSLEWSAEIPAGAFRMGSGSEAFQCRLIQRPYRLAKYPVTVAQFDRFVEWGGYRAQGESLWPAKGWRIMRGEESPDFSLESEQWRESFKNWFEGEGRPWRGPRALGSRFETPNHPVVGISWYEAVAFCRWLNQTQSGKLGLPSGWGVRLPTEAEWERAASVRSGKSVEYPWGAAKNVEGRCNVEPSGLGGTSSVGLFGSQGAAECGAEELSGNVWEWCGTAWREDYQGYEKAPEIRAELDPLRCRDESDREALRVVRGGAWIHAPDDARAAFRLRYLPDDRLNSLGFRLAASPISAL
jgi:formylglycine-generating enzyme required for sulfatase activity